SSSDESDEMSNPDGAMIIVESCKILCAIDKFIARPVHLHHLPRKRIIRRNFGNDKSFKNEFCPIARRCNARGFLFFFFLFA
ncbi:hypothetical protein BE221DRAFT_66645, partial [Ostreococcus tauri]